MNDDLTGLYSRNGFVAFARQQLVDAIREKRKVLLLLVRLDNLEWINEKYGVHEGEHALREVARLLNDIFRTSDLMGRIDESLFLLFGLEVSGTIAEILSTRFRKKLETYEVETSLPFPLLINLSEANWDPQSPVPLEELLSDMEKRMNEEAQ